jgi:hypothetical protein
MAGAHFDKISNTRIIGGFYIEITKKCLIIEWHPRKSILVFFNTSKIKRYF